MLAVTNESKEPESGFYKDKGGRVWFCVNRDGSMVCNSTDGWFTSAYLRTFQLWGWEPTQQRSL